MFKIYLIRSLCYFIPPILAQRLRSFFIDLKEGEELARDFNTRVFTGGVFVGNTMDFHALKVLIHGYFDWRNIILSKAIQMFKPGTIVEVGANVGTETISLSDIIKQGKVYAYEPVPFNYQFLEKIKEVNPTSQIEIYNKAVSDSSGKVFFEEPEVSYSGSGFVAQAATENTIEVDAIRLDDSLKEEKSLSTILIDVEGFEYQVILGAMSLIKKHKPFIILEANARYLEKRGGVTLKKMYDHMESLGYISFYIDKLGIHPVIISDFQVKANKNWLCIPKEQIDKQLMLSRKIGYNAWNPFMRWFTV